MTGDPNPWPMDLGKRWAAPVARMLETLLPHRLWLVRVDLPSGERDTEIALYRVSCAGNRSALVLAMDQFAVDYPGANVYRVGVWREGDEPAFFPCETDATRAAVLDMVARADEIEPLPLRRKEQP